VLGRLYENQECSATRTLELVGERWSLLILHGDDDQIVPIAVSALRSSKVVKGATLKVYPGLPHGMCSTHKDQINTDLLSFFREETRAATGRTSLRPEDARPEPRATS
jgi:dienelactone hydrolase